MSKPGVELTLRAKIFLIFFGIGVALCALEVALRILGGKGSSTFGDVNELRAAMIKEGNTNDAQGGGATLKSLIMPHVSDDIIYELQPNLSVRFQRSRVETNDCGMRSPQRTIAKPGNTFRVGLLGDSFAFGWGVEQRESFAQRIEDNLNRAMGDGVNVEVLNFGVPGYSTFQEVSAFLEKGAAFNVDALVVFFIKNDFGPPFFIQNLQSDGLIASSQLAAIASRLVDPKAAERALQEAGRDPNRSLRVLSDYAREAHIPLFIAISPRKDWRETADQLWILRDRRDINLMKLRDDFLRAVETRGIPVEQLTLSFDPHPSPLRHAIYGDIMSPYILNHIN